MSQGEWLGLRQTVFGAFQGIEKNNDFLKAHFGPKKTPVNCMKLCFVTSKDPLPGLPEGLPYVNYLWT